MTISQVAEQAQLAWTKQGVCVNLAKRAMDRSRCSDRDVDHAKAICATSCLER
jgi:hypothetical protein